MAGQNARGIWSKILRKTYNINQQNAGFLQLYCCLIKKYYRLHITDTLKALLNPTKLNFKPFSRSFFTQFKGRKISTKPYILRDLLKLYTATH